MILGKIWRSFKAQLNKLANALRGADPIAEMEYERDRYLQELKAGKEGLAQYRALVERVARQVGDQQKLVDTLEARVRVLLNSGDRETAAKIALDLQRAKTDLAENRKQLEIHETAYDNNLTKIKHAEKKLEEIRDKVAKYAAELKMSKSEAELAELANKFEFNVTTDLGDAESIVKSKIDLNRARVRVAADLSAEGLDKVKNEMAVEKAMAEDALKQFEREAGLVTPETAKTAATQTKSSEKVVEGGL